MRTEGSSVGDAFGNIRSFAEVGGRPYFFVSTADIDPHIGTRVSFSVSEAALGGKCKIGALYDGPDNPPCARVVFAGMVSKIAHGGNAYYETTAALAKKHPYLASLFPKAWNDGHYDFYVCTMNVDHIWLIDMYGEAEVISPGDYFPPGRRLNGPLLV
jgi:hypothetical protein